MSRKEEFLQRIKEIKRSDFQMVVNKQMTLVNIMGKEMITMDMILNQK